MGKNFTAAKKKPQQLKSRNSVNLNITGMLKEWKQMEKNVIQNEFTLDGG